MASRLGLLDPSSMDSNHKADYDVLNDYITSRYGAPKTAKDENGRLLGPFGAQLHLPGIAQHFVGIAKALLAVPGLSERARSVAINVVGAHSKAVYEQAAHRRNALRLGFSEAQLDDIEKGTCPPGLGDDEKIAFEVASALITIPGPLSQDIWDRSVTVLGKTGAMVLIQYVGFYRYVATLLNGFDVQLPEAAF